VTKNRNDARIITTPQSLNTYVKGICDIMRRSNCTSALQYVPELTWMLFLRILDEKEAREVEVAIEPLAAQIWGLTGAELKEIQNSPEGYRSVASPSASFLSMPRM